LLRAALIAALAVLVAPAASLAATCPKDAQCSSIAVPLDHTGGTPGTLPLAWARMPATGTRTGTLVLLAGGPGQAAIPLTKDVSELLDPLRSRYDLVFVDQRGTGRSGATSCTLDRAADVPTCATKLGAKRAFLNTTETARDLEDMRVALGVDKLTLLGVSYGTKVAGEYARRYPQHTAAAVLDSPVSVDGLDGVERLPLLGAPRVLREVCYPGPCHDTVRDPQAALKAAVERLQRGAISGPVVSLRGHVSHARVTEQELFGLLGISDLSPFLRARLPAALASLATGDAAPLLHTLVLSLGGGTDMTDESEGINGARLLATTCVEGHLPWAPDSPVATRKGALADYIAALGPSPFAPFRPTTVLAGSAAELCTAWPPTPKPEGVPSAGPDVPVLVLSGREDLRTPTEDARRTAAQFPRAQLLAVPDVGHSVLTSDISGCALGGLREFLAGKPLVQCSARKQNPFGQVIATLLFTATPYVPASIDDIAPVGGHGLPGRTLDAFELTFRQLGTDFFLSLGQALSQRSFRIPGVRAGYAEVSEKAFELHGVEAIRGVRVSGTITDSGGRFEISGPAAAAGTLTLTTRGGAVGTLGGRAVSDRVFGPADLFGDLTKLLGD
jgi:pimeloyl-ACP methyl ester carboxylesterase